MSRIVSEQSLMGIRFLREGPETGVEALFAPLPRRKPDRRGKNSELE
jgi:hypothetical protein